MSRWLKILSGFLVIITLVILPTFIPIGSRDPDPEIELYLLSNDVHVGIVLPLKNDVVDWSQFFDLSEFQNSDEWFQLGWGDKTFYFEVPEWRDLTLIRALDALLIPGEPVIHVDFLGPHPRLMGAIPFKVSRDRYRSLAIEIRKRFKKKDHRPILIPEKSYGTKDNFYLAHGAYSLLRTCNNWTADLLGSQNLLRPLWSPTKYGLQFMYQ
jgi:uncharacterized protein (TIGR02117 family)